MLAVGGTSCISLVSVAAADENSLTPLHRLLPTETASLGFGGNPVGGGDKNSHFTFFRHFYVGGVSLPSGRFVCVGTTRRGVYFSRKNGFLRVGALRRRTLCSLLHTVLFRRSCMGSGITTLGVRFMPLKRWTPAGHGGVFVVFMPSRNLPRAGRISPRRVHTPPQPLTAHTAAHTPKHGGFSGSMVTMFPGPFFSLPIMWYPPFCPYCLASVYNLLGDTRQGFLSIFSTSPPHIHGFHGNLSDATAW